MEDIKYCKLCLAAEVKMYSLNMPTLHDAYTRLLQLPDIDKYQQYVCFECASLLGKYKDFYTKCQIAHNILSSIEPDLSKISKHTIQHVNRKLYRLESQLRKSVTITYNDQFQLPQDCADIDEKFLIDEIKTEVDIESDIQRSSIVVQTPNDKLDTTLLNGSVIIKESNDISSHYSDNEYIPKKKKKRNSDMTNKKKQNSRKRKDKRNVKIKVDVKSKRNGFDECFSDLDDVPLSRRISKKTDLDKKINGVTIGAETIFEKNTSIELEIKEPVKRKSGPKFDESFFEDYATVVLLTAEEAKKEVLIRKESSNYKNCPYKCDMCYRGYEAKVTFANHMKKHSQEFGEWECDFCHLRFPEQKLLYKHHFSCHKRKFYCKICSYTCFCTHQAKTHVSLHKGKKYPCMECGEVFSMPNSLLMHKRVKHVTQCVCELCGSTFATQRGLFSHKMILHRQEPNANKGPKCEDCGVQFSTELAWKRHLVLSSKHKVSNGCEYCGETFPDDESLKTHVKVHSRKQINRGDNVKLPAACTICDKWLTNRTEYKSHMTSQHPLSDAAKRIDAKEQIQCVCEVCGKVFKKQCFLLYHQRKHTGERPYSCRECGKSYAFPGALSTHRSAHRRARAIQCHMCQKVFTFRSALNKHVKAHLGIRPHKCPMCDKSFPNPCDVKLHMKYVHYKVPWPKRERTKRNADRADLL